MEMMVDIETLGIAPGTPILSIGAVAFEGDVIHRTFESKILLEDYVNYPDAKIEADTVVWHLQQPWEVVAANFLEGEDSVGRAIHKFAGFCEEVNPSKYWSYGDFDRHHLTLWTKRFGRTTLPWSHRNWFDLRTVLAEAGASPPASRHTALEDATLQARMLIAVRNCKDKNRLEIDMRGTELEGLFEDLVTIIRDVTSGAKT